MPVRLSDVAARAGVSISAASRVLSHAPSRIRPETRERIEAAARELGYRPNFAGRALKLARSDVLAMVVPDLTNPIFAELVRGVEDAARDSGRLVLLGRSEEVGGSVITRLIGEGRVDGIVLQLGENTSPDEVQELVRQQAPVVFINSILDGPPGSVALPNAAGTALATRELLQLGHRKIGYLGGSPSVITSAAREQGFVDAMTDAGLRVRTSWLTRFGYAAGDGRRALRKLWSAKLRPTAVVVANLNAAIGALAEARALGIAVPEQLSVVAVHDAWTAEHTSPALTTVRMPLYAMGRRGVGQLLEKLGGAKIDNTTIEDPGPELVTRASTASPATKE